MQHHNRKPATAESSPLDNPGRAPTDFGFRLDRRLINQHIAEGRRLRADALATFGKALFNRLFPPHSKQGAVPGGGTAKAAGAIQTSGSIGSWPGVAGRRAAGIIRRSGRGAECAFAARLLGPASWGTSRYLGGGPSPGSPSASR